MGSKTTKDFAFRILIKEVSTVIWKSNLNKDKYPRESNYKKYLTGDTENLDPIFRGRLAYFAKVKGVVLKITDGYREYAEQVRLWNLYQRWKKTGIGTVKSASKPGNSYHGYGVAVDTSTQPIRNMTSKELYKYGLCKPISSEMWHIQPIELNNTGTYNDKYKKYLPIDLAPEMIAKYNLSDETIKFLETYIYASEFCTQLLGGITKFSVQTINFLKTYKYGEALIERFGITHA